MAQQHRGPRATGVAALGCRHRRALAKDARRDVLDDGPRDDSGGRARTGLRANRAAVPGLRIESNWFITLSALLLTSPMSRRRTIILNSSSISAYLWAPTSLSMSRASRGSHPYVAARLTSLPTLCACIVRPAHCLSAPNVVVARSSNVIHNLGCSLTARRTPSYVHSSSSTKCHTCPIRLPSRRPNRPCPVVLTLVKSPSMRSLWTLTASSEAPCGTGPVHTSRCVQPRSPRAGSGT